MTATPEELAKITFEASGIELEQDLDQWLDRARQEYSMSRVAAVLHNMDDEQLEQFIVKLGENLDQRGEALADLAEWFQSWNEHYKAAADVTGAAFARLMIMAGRIADGRLS